MIPRLLVRVARRFADASWLHDMRRHEVLSRRATQRLEREWSPNDNQLERLMLRQRLAKEGGDPDERR